MTPTLAHFKHAAATGDLDFLQHALTVLAHKPRPFAEAGLSDALERACEGGHAAVAALLLEAKGGPRTETALFRGLEQAITFDRGACFEVVLAALKRTSGQASLFTTLLRCAVRSHRPAMFEALWTAAPPGTTLERAVVEVAREMPAHPMFDRLMALTDPVVALNAAREPRRRSGRQGAVMDWRALERVLLRVEPAVREAWLATRQITEQVPAVRAHERQVALAQVPAGPSRARMRA